MFNKNTTLNPFQNASYAFDKKAKARHLKMEQATTKRVNRYAKKLARTISKSGTAVVSLEDLKKFAKVGYLSLAMTTFDPVNEGISMMDVKHLPKPIPQLVGNAIDAGLTVSYVWRQKMETPDKLFECVGLRFSAKTK